MDKVNWKQLQSNPLLQGLNPSMMTDEGYIKQKQDRIIGMSRYAPKLSLEVVFDKEYVMTWFETVVFEKLQVTDWNSFQSIMSEAWKRYKSKHQEEVKKAKG